MLVMFVLIKTDLNQVQIFKIIMHGSVSVVITGI